MPKKAKAKTKRKPLNILWGSEQPMRPTGYATVSRELIKRLVARGHTVNVMGWDYNGEDMKHEEGWTIVQTGVGNFGGDFTNGRGSATTLDMNLIRLKPDVYFSLIDIWFTGHMIKSCNTLKIPHVAYTPIDAVPFSYLWLDLISRIHTPLMMSHFGVQQFEEFVEKYKTNGTGPVNMREPFLDRYDGYKTPLLYHGVDLDVFKPVSEEQKQAWKNALGIGHWEVIFSSVARNTNRKQIPRLLYAMKKVVDSASNPNEIGLVLHCGDPSDSMGMGGWNLPQMVNEMGLSKNVTFSDTTNNPIGFGLSREDLAKVYAISDCHVMATGGEGFGIPSAEALATGIPIILPDNSTGPELVQAKGGLSPKMIRDGKNGMLVGCDTLMVGPKWNVQMGIVNIDSLANAMSLIVKKGVPIEEWGKNARKFAEEHFDWNKLTDELEDILYKAVDTPHALGNNSVIRHG